uniref:hypothetical protein n=1 Tax=Prevotella sp. TaxID=59823 RepID=UPI004029F43E
MDKELLEQILKGRISVQGDLVLEKHVEHEIGNVEAGGIGIQIVQGGAAAALPVDKPSPGARKQFLFIGGKPTEENAGVKNREKEKFLRWLSDHKMSERQLVARKDDGLNKAVVCFLKLWREKGLVAENPSGGAVFRFLTDDCGLKTDVTEASYSNKIKEWLRGNNYDVATYQNLRNCI